MKVRTTSRYAQPILILLAKGWPLETLMQPKMKLISHRPARKKSHTTIATLIAPYSFLNKIRFDDFVDVVQCHRSEVGYIHGKVEGMGERIVERLVVMHMAVAQYHFGIVPHNHVVERLVLQREMAHHKVQPLVWQVGNIVNSNLLRILLIDGELTQRIVIAAHQMNVAVEPMENGCSIVGQAHNEIAQMVYSVLGLNDAVPVGDECLVHVVVVKERPVAILDDVIVIEVGIRSQKDTHLITPFMRRSCSVWARRKMSLNSTTSLVGILSRSSS
ncbi:MAG TPA: hypothetical protein [Caudoviricetes sp.]|nr:MAG TPA: hypothetical protein [Caudoviricetes sp.]